MSQYRGHCQHLHHIFHITMVKLLEKFHYETLELIELLHNLLIEQQSVSSLTYLCTWMGQTKPL